MEKVLESLYQKFKGLGKVTNQKKVAYLAAAKDFDYCQDELFSLAEKGSSCEMSRVYEGFKAADQKLKACADALIAAFDAEHAAWTEYSNKEIELIVLSREEFKSDYANWVETSGKIEALLAEQEA